MDKSVKEEVKEPVKEEKPAEVKAEPKLSGWKSVLALLLLLGIISVSIYALYSFDIYTAKPKGVIDIEEVKKEKPLESKELIEAINPDVKRVVLNYLMLDLENQKVEVKEEKKEENTTGEEEEEDTTFTYGKFINSLANNRKLLLGEIADGKKFDDIKQVLKKKFNSDLDVQSHNLTVNDNGTKKDIYIYKKDTNTYLLNEENKDVKLDVLPLDGEIIDFEYDDPVNVEESETTVKVTTYSLFELKDGEKSTINNKKKDLIPDELKEMPIEELKEKLKEDYPDKKENFDVITYTLEKVDGRYLVIDVVINNL